MKLQTVLNRFGAIVTRDDTSVVVHTSSAAVDAFRLEHDWVEGFKVYTPVMLGPPILHTGDGTNDTE